MQKSHIRNTILGLLIIVGLNSVTAQIRKLDTSDDKLQRIEALDLYGYKPTLTPVGKETPTNEFNFEYRFNDINMLLSLDGAMRKAQRDALNRWLGKQENVFKDEINKILGTNYNNFKDAQKELLKRRETKLIAVNVNQISKSYKDLGAKFNEEQEAETLRLYALKNYSASRNPKLGDVIIDGRTVKDIINARTRPLQLSEEKRVTSQLITKFSNKEYESAKNIHWANGVYGLQFDNNFISGYVQNHISIYNGKSQFDKVILMAAYLNTYVYNGPVIYPNSFQIPSFYSPTSLLDKGKAVSAPRFKIEELVFSPNYIENTFGACMNGFSPGPNCAGQRQYLIEMKDRIISEHQNSLLKFGEALGNKLFGSQWRNTNSIKWLDELNLTNLDMVNKTKSYLTKYNDAPDALNFAREALRTFGEGGKVDYDNEIIKDKSFIGTKADCVLSSLLSSGNKTFQNTINAFTNNNSKFKLKFTTYFKTNDSADARTGFPENKDSVITIKFNLANTSRSQAIDLATVLIHEGIHAELHRIKISNNAGPKPLSASLYDRYLRLWELYSYKETNNLIASASQHYLMAESYIVYIAAGLRKFDNNTHPVENYMSYAWRGLEEAGIRANILTKDQRDKNYRLSAVISTDSNKNPCD
ncbi:hypothetical protein [Cellulophaga baltica]|uniref:DUF4932 domain-containing protein n=1 Tax=Cellulophaga baltica 18 TaxID=1348584 RepID=A0AAU8RYP7_9FLAO|nr:hypothetical protein [Cellulophaga baltica]AIZ42374.1 hypothetical protein M666_12760 [Cellulophaga baltica 18]